MTVTRIVANIATPDPARAKTFYEHILGLSLLMDHGWLRTYGNQQRMSVQVSFAEQGGGDTPVPDLSVEVDDFDAVLARINAAGIGLEYGPVTEPWGVRRFFVRDPFDRLVNILEHLTE